MCHITQLPSEIWLQIIEVLCMQDVKALSLVSSSISKNTASRLFKHIAINTPDNLSLVPSFLERYGRTITKLHYTLYLCADKFRTTNDNEHYHQDDDKKAIHSILPALQDLLRGDRTPNLNHIKLSFKPIDTFDGLNIYEWEDYWEAISQNSKYQLNHISEHLESAAQVSLAESTSQWRADIWRVFDAVSNNINLRHLEIENLLPRECSFWRTKEWKDFLGRLTSLQLQIWGGSSECCVFRSDFRACFQDFMRRLRPNLFMHLKRLKQLHLSSGFPIGCEGEYHCPSPFLPEDLPCIEYLRLENCFIDQTLQKFISARKDTLCEFALIDCTSAKTLSGRGSANNALRWATFLRSIRELQPFQLTKLVIDNDRIYLGEDHSSEIAYTLEQLTKNVRIFAYHYMDLGGQRGTQTGWGTAALMTEDIVESLENGQDEEEYDALMEVVAKNAERKYLGKMSCGPLDDYDHDTNE